MNAKNASHSRPLTVCCILCGGQVEVAPKGNIPSAHKPCAELLRSIRRIAADIDDAATCDGVNLRAMVSKVNSEVQSVLTTARNEYANPAKRS